MQDITGDHAAVADPHTHLPGGVSRRLRSRTSGVWRCPLPPRRPTRRRSPLHGIGERGVVQTIFGMRPESISARPGSTVFVAGPRVALPVRPRAPDAAALFQRGCRISLQGERRAGHCCCVDLGPCCSCFQHHATSRPQAHPHIRQTTWYPTTTTGMCRARVDLVWSTLMPNL